MKRILARLKHRRLSSLGCHLSRRRLLSSRIKADDDKADDAELIVRGVEAMTLNEALLPPRINLLAGDQEYLNAVLSRLQHGTRERFEQYLKLVVLGIVAIFGFAGSGKTETLAVATLIYMQQPDIGNVYAAAPTHVATSKFADRLHLVGCETVSSLDQQCLAAAGRVFNPLVVRGYKMDVELHAFVTMVSKASEDSRADDLCNPWQCPLGDEPFRLRVAVPRLLGSRAFGCMHVTSPFCTTLARRSRRTRSTLACAGSLPATLPWSRWRAMLTTSSPSSSSRMTSPSSNKMLPRTNHPRTRHSSRKRSSLP